MSEVVLEVSQLTKGYKTQNVLKDVSFTLEASTATALVGPVGAGKSTLIRTLAGLEVPDEGSVSLFGSSNEKELCRARRQTGFVLEMPFGYAELTVLRNLIHRSSLYGKPDLARIKELRKEMRLTERDHVGVKEKLRLLSLGAEKRYSLACALMPKPRLLILDEPLTGIDRENRSFLTDQLVRLREEGVTLLISGQSAAELQTICTRALLLEEGVLRGPVSMEEAVKEEETEEAKEGEA
jgi:ABC-type multidrug transport system, ATPase component